MERAVDIRARASASRSFDEQPGRQIAGTHQSYSHAKITQGRWPERFVVCVVGGECEGNGCPGIHGNHMKSGVPATLGLADGLWTVFFSAPVPSDGRTLRR